MKYWRNKLFYLAILVGVGIPALSQNVPQSILPPGFEDPATLPARETQPQKPRSGTKNTDAAPSASVENGVAAIVGDEEAGLFTDIFQQVETPDYARRPIDLVGPLAPGNYGLGTDAFGRANGRYLSILMQRLDAPLPSRWTSILLRRALLSHIPAPAGTNPVDWVAERAWLLLRMGEADGARILVQSVDTDRFTPKMLSVAAQVALATADPAALCPLVQQGRKVSIEVIWILSDAICAALRGEASRANALIDQARRHGGGSDIDFLLAEKVIGGGTNTRRSVTIQWKDVNQINSWRFGLAAAAGMDIPERLLNAAGPRVQAWQARAPMIPIDQRVGAAETAAALGVFSNSSLVEMYSLINDTTDITEYSGSVGARLHTAYADPSTAARIKAIRDLWDETKNPNNRYARQILTAVAAFRLAPSQAIAGNAPDLLASMLAAGIDRNLGQWSAMLGAMDGATQTRAWALLAVASPRPAFDINADLIDRYRANDDSLEGYKSKLLIAALAGMGRIDGATRDEYASNAQINFSREDIWTKAVDNAARARQPGTVALLVAIAMQTPHWRGVPPEYFYRMIRALHQVGLDYEARMIAAEALSRA